MYTWSTHLYQQIIPHKMIPTAIQHSPGRHNIQQSRYGRYNVTSVYGIQGRRWWYQITNQKRMVWVVLYPIFVNSNMIYLTIFEIFDITIIFHRNNVNK